MEDFYGDLYLNLYNHFAENNSCGDYDTDELKINDQAFVFYLESLDIKDEERRELRELMSAVGTEYEKQGFIYGVATGLRLMNKADELLGKGGFKNE